VKLAVLADMLDLVDRIPSDWLTAAADFVDLVNALPMSLSAKIWQLSRASFVGINI